MIFAPSDIGQALANLRAQKTRTLLTALGIVFGVGSVIGMLAIGAGAREESLRFIEQLGVRNVLVESRSATSQEEFQQRRRSSPGLSERDVRILKRQHRSPRNLVRPPYPPPRLRPPQTFPRYPRDVRRSSGLQPSSTVSTSRKAQFFDDADDAASSKVCVLGEGAKINLLGYGAARGKFVKVNDVWLEVVGVLTEQLMAGAQNTGGAMQDLNNIVYIPLNTFQYRFWDQSEDMKDDLDGIDLRLKAPTPTALKSPKW
jgi:putative ABC transport system permease protein